MTAQNLHLYCKFSKSSPAELCTFPINFSAISRDYARFSRNFSKAPDVNFPLLIAGPQPTTLLSSSSGSSSWHNDAPLLHLGTHLELVLTQGSPDVVLVRHDAKEGRMIMNDLTAGLQGTIRALSLTQEEFKRWIEVIVSDTTLQRQRHLGVPWVVVFVIIQLFPGVGVWEEVWRFFGMVFLQKNRPVFHPISGGGWDVSDNTQWYQIVVFLTNPCVSWFLAIFSNTQAYRGCTVRIKGITSPRG